MLALGQLSKTALKHQTLKSGPFMRCALPVTPARRHHTLAVSLTDQDESLGRMHSALQTAVSIQHERETRQEALSYGCR